MASSTSVAYSGNADIDGVLSGVRWTDLNLTYSFAATGLVSIGSLLSVKAETMSNVQRDAVRSILKFAESLTGLRFTEVADNKNSQGTLRFGESATQTTASGYYPGSSQGAGDAWFNVLDYNSPKLGSYAFLTMMHEIGHTIGLDHGHEGGRALPANHDSLEYSVMTYRSYVGGPVGAYSVRDGSFPRSFMLNDLAALQYMYGGNYGTNAGNTVYKWSPTTGELSIDGTGKGASTTNTILETIWDGGGTDTYDFSAYTTALRVDINPGGWTTTSNAQLAALGTGKVAVGNIASAYLYNGNAASLIENVKGGSGNDVIVGNAAANTLEGGNGNDTLTGGGGSDRFLFNVAPGSRNVDTIVDFYTTPISSASRTPSSRPSVHRFRLSSSTPGPEPRRPTMPMTTLSTTRPPGRSTMTPTETRRAAPRPFCSQRWPASPCSTIATFSSSRASAPRRG